MTDFVLYICNRDFVRNFWSLPEIKQYLDGITFSLLATRSHLQCSLTVFALYKSIKNNMLLSHIHVIT